MVYEGREKYIFVSYSHKDADKVLSIIDALNANGYRVWYDSGIEAGTEWPEYIEEHLINSHVVLVFMSPSAVESRNCRNEINFALELKKEMLVVYLEDTELLKGMRLQLNSTQSLFRKHHTSDESFIQSLVKAKILQECREDQDTPVAPIEASAQEIEETPVVPTPPAPVKKAPPEKAPPRSTDSKNKKAPLFIILGIVLLIAVILICVFAFGDNYNDDTTTTTFASDVTTTTDQDTSPTVPRDPIAMSDKLFDLTFELEGTVYQLPCLYDDFAAAGWTISTSGVSSDKSVKAGGKESFEMSKNGKKISLVAYNHGTAPTLLKDCTIGSISWETGDNVDARIAKGITTKSTVDQIVEAFGAPRTRHESSDYTSLSYELSDTGVMVYFCCYNDDSNPNNSYISLKNPNPITDGNPQINSGPAVMSDNLFDYTVEIEGTVFKFPCKYEDFTNAGWTISSSNYSPDKKLNGNSNDSFYMSKDGKKILVYSYNTSGNAVAIKDCPIGGVEWTVGSGINATLAKGITAKSSADDIISAFGTADDRNNLSNYTILYYRQGSLSNQVRFYCYKTADDMKYSSVSIKNFVAIENESTETSTQAPSYLSGYNAPSALGYDITSATVSIDGELYQLPAPVSAFVNNGWEIIEMPYFVAAGKTDNVTISRSGKKITLHIKNYSDYQTTALNCAVYAVAISSEDGVSVELPGGLTFSSTKANVDAAASSDLRYYDQTSNHFWSYSKNGRSVEITVDKSTNKISKIRVIDEIWSY